jgi:hypothetical protein
VYQCQAQEILDLQEHQQVLRLVQDQAAACQI